ncbi:TVG0902620 [Thermoplasma volcanium GSS1]|uniref:TVG0902620 protein n=1 Tax=Thermoplasma volcanium (strain ATCC 51530 / DSM 4299 / JCM 9571 / NBRC 15438 / GSS1) TaxID=273116 RepID=Q97AC6_THEVO|nr:hypothetical protein [Thermoplasma volcanium]BAB60026.1 TVG0902620 [Thermoplasma volcanium GSS1]
MFSNDNSLSGKIYDTLKITNGNVVSFLEDDDLFTSNKLEIVFNLFKNENACYYHNASEIVDKFGHSLNIKNTDPYFNSSSISIRKDIIYRDIIKEIPKGVNTVLYINALDSGKEIVNGYEALTYYRAHKSETHFTGSLEEIASSDLNLAKLAVASFEILYKRLINKNRKQ